MLIAVISLLTVLLVIQIGVIFAIRKKNDKFSRQQRNIIDSLGIVYRDVFVADENSGKLIAFKVSPDTKKLFSAIYESKNYEETISTYVQQLVIDEDKHLFKHVVKRQKVISILKEKKEYSFIYRLEYLEQIIYFQITFLKNNENSSNFVIAFKNVDDMMSQQLKEQQFKTKLIDMQDVQLSIMSSISGIYLTMHLLDLHTNTFVEINTSVQVRNNTVGNADAPLQMQNIINAVCSLDYLEKALAFTDLSTLPRRLKGKKTIAEVLHGKYHGWFRASFIPVECDDKGYPFKVLFVTQVIDEEKRLELSLKDTATKDGLTGIFNRYSFEEDLSKLKCDAPSDDFVYVSMDVNGLKNVNDTMGHEAGDDLIRGAASCIEKIFSPYGKVYRTGGDEFQALIYADSATLDKLKNDFDKTVADWSGKIVSELHISAGYVQKSEKKGLSIMVMSRMADERMYKAKSLFYSSKGIDRRGQQAAYEALCHSYTKILKIDLLKDDYTIIQMNSFEKDSNYGFREKISVWLKEFALSGQVHNEDLENYLAHTDLNYLKTFLSENTTFFSLQYRRKIGDTFKKVIMEIIPAKDFSSENQIAYLYVKDIDKF